MKAKGVLSKWKSKVSTAAVNKPEQKADDESDVPKSGLKMVFAMSHQKKEEEKTVKVIRKKDNRLISEDAALDEPSDSDVSPKELPEQYLRKRRNALGKVKPIRTLRKRPHSEMPNSEVKKGEPANNKSEKAVKNVDATEMQVNTAEGKRKAEFVKKALMAKNKLEKITVVRQDSGDQILSQMYTLNDDYVYRHEWRHLAAALRSDDFAAGPFMSFITGRLKTYF